MARVYAPDDVAIALPVKMRVVPVASVILATLTVALPLGASAPLWPPLGMMLLLCWRLMRNTVWPIWIGLPLGLVDDLATGQPVGCAMALWTVMLLALDAVDRRVIWRDFWVDWALAAIAVLLYLVIAALIANAGSLPHVLALVGPQILWSILLLPVTMRGVAALDTWRQRR